jgi:uncharacterized protein (TIGR03083 family)
MGTLDAMQALPRVDVMALFPEERAALLELLGTLSDEQWLSPTVCAGWTVKDIAAHIMADDLGVVARGRDRWPGRFSGTWSELLLFIDRQNGQWVETMRRLSPRLVRELLAFSGERAFAFFGEADLDAEGSPVDWAGPGPSPVWLDIAREYTERWLHQQQIRDAVGISGLKDRRMFAPVLATFVRALPHTYRDTAAPAGTLVRVSITGEAGGDWSLLRNDDAWTLHAANDAQPPAARITLDQDTAWRLFTKGVTPGAARAAATLEGDERLAAVALNAVAIIA